VVSGPYDWSTSLPRTFGYFGLHPGTYTVSIASRNADGVSTPVTTTVTLGAYVAAAPANVTAHATGADITVDWGTVDSFADSYVVDLSHDGDLVATHSVTAVAWQSSGSTTFTDQAPGDYDVTVRAVNAAGDSDAVPASVTVAIPAPDAPTNVAATNDSALGVTVTWDSSDAYTTGFDVALVQDGTTVATESVGGDMRSATFDGVTPGHYDVTVIATNTTDDSAPGTAAVTVATTVPTMGVVTATSAAHNEVTVAWPAAADGGEPVTAYVVTVHQPGANLVQTLVADVRTASFVGVTAGDRNVSVVATNAVGDSVEGTASVTVADKPVVTPPSVKVPGVPMNLRHGPVTKPGRVTLSWTAPKPVPGAPIQQFLVTVDGRAKTVSGGKTSTRIKGLGAGPAAIKVRAVNKNGTSKALRGNLTVPKNVARPTRRTLRFGMDSLAVEKLQHALGVDAAGHVFGTSTRHAVLLWQASHGKTQTGVANDRMRFLLRV
jgi:hypothetical protein